MTSDILNRVGMVLSETGGAYTYVVANNLISNRFNTPGEAGAVDGRSYWWMIEEENDYMIFEGVWTLSTMRVAIGTIWHSKIANAHGTAKMTLGGNATLRSPTPAEFFDLVLVRGDKVQAWSSAQKKQARENIGVQKKNYILNGAMMVSQENGSNVGAVSGFYPVDQFYISNGAGGSFQIGRVSAVTPAGSPNRISVVVTSPDTSIAAGETQGIIHPIEGYSFADLMYGTASAKSATLRFGVNAPAGTYSVSIRNPSAARTYVGEYVISGGEAGTDVYKSIVIPGDQAGTWPKDNQTGVSLCWTLVCGSTYQGAAGGWYAANYVGSTNQSNFMGTNGATFQLFDVGLYEGVVAPDFVVPDLAETLRRCQRYWEVMTFGGIYFPNSAPGALMYAPLNFTEKRTSSPTLTMLSSTTNICWTNGGSNASPTTFSLSVITGKSGRVNAGLSTSTMGGILPFDFSVNARL